MKKVWTYLISKPLGENELSSLEGEGKKFVNGWTAHENKLSADFEIYKNRIVVVKVDEQVYSASGCSIDKLQRFVKETEQKFGVEMLNRLLVAYESPNGIEVIHSSQAREALGSGKITGDTIVYNTSVSNESELENWRQPLKATWLNKYLEKV